MKNQLTAVLIATLILPVVLLAVSPANAEDYPLPPMSPAESWQPPDNVTQSIEPPANVEAYSQMGSDLQMLAPSIITPGIPGSIINAYLVNSYGQVMTRLYRSQTCYLIVSFDGPGYFYLWEYYPSGTSPHGHWLCYRWYRPYAGIWRIGPFAAQAFDPAGRYYWRMWFLSGSSWTTHSLSYEYTGSYYPPDIPGFIQEQVSSPVINAFSSSKSTIELGETAILSWTTTSANSVTISPGVGTVATSGSTTVTPRTTTTYSLVATGRSGSSVSSTSTITVTPRIPPTITVGQVTIQKGQTTALTWNAPGAIGVWITDIGSVSLSGTLQVSPPVTTTYTLTASYIDGIKQSVSVTVNVEQPPYLLWGIIAFLLIAAIITVALLVRRPGKAHRAEAADTHAGHIIKDEETQSTDTLPATTPVGDAVPAILTMPEGHEILLAGNARSFGRKDFEEFIPPDHVAYISRQHITIWYDSSQYYIEDRSSTNGTRINGVDIKGNGRHVLADGDQIELAGKMTLTFKIQNTKKEVE